MPACVRVSATGFVLPSVSASNTPQLVKVSFSTMLARIAVMQALDGEIKPQRPELRRKKAKRYQVMQ